MPLKIGRVRDSATILEVMETDWISHRHTFQLSATQGLLLHGTNRSLKVKLLENIPQHLESAAEDSMAPEFQVM